MWSVLHDSWIVCLEAVGQGDWNDVPKNHLSLGATLGARLQKRWTIWTGWRVGGHYCTVFELGVRFKTCNNYSAHHTSHMHHVSHRHHWSCVTLKTSSNMCQSEARTTHDQPGGSCLAWHMIRWEEILVVKLFEMLERGFPSLRTHSIDSTRRKHGGVERSGRYHSHFLPKSILSVTLHTLNTWVHKGLPQYDPKHPPSPDLEKSMLCYCQFKSEISTVTRFRGRGQEQHTGLSLTGKHCVSTFADVRPHMQGMWLSVGPLVPGSVIKCIYVSVPFLFTS